MKAPPTLLPLRIIALLTLVLVPAAAFAQAVAGTAADISADPAKLAALVLDAVVHKNWGVLVSALLVGSIGAAKKFVPGHTVVGKFLHGKLGGWLTNFGMTASGAVLATLVAGQSFSVGTLLSAIQVGLGAAGLYELYNDVAKKEDTDKAAGAGAAAAANPGPTLNA